MIGEAASYFKRRLHYPACLDMCFFLSPGLLHVDPGTKFNMYSPPLLLKKMMVVVFKSCGFFFFTNDVR